MKYFIITLLLSWAISAAGQGVAAPERIALKDGWTFAEEGKGEWRTAEVPGTVHGDLLRHGLLPDPFYGKNVQSMLKLGRAQGVAMAAALLRDIPIAEYAPLKVKQSITGNGGASKDQVAEMLRRILNIPKESIDPHLDATDALAVALCHFYESARPKIPSGCKSWKEFIARNPDKIHKN